MQWTEPWLSVQSLRDIGCHAACPVGINSGAQRFMLAVLEEKSKVFFFWPGVKIDEESVGVLQKSEYEEVSKFNGSKISETQKAA